uniref:Uncharacterized protein n=1 Tax=Talaromyces marneffei PM1 TaxID=1077442 RepID=A0A093VBV4_TALMA
MGPRLAVIPLLSYTGRLSRYHGLPLEKGVELFVYAETRIQTSLFSKGSCFQLLDMNPAQVFKHVTPSSTSPNIMAVTSVRHCHCQLNNNPNNKLFDIDSMTPLVTDDQSVILVQRPEPIHGIELRTWNNFRGFGTGARYWSSGFGYPVVLIEVDVFLGTHTNYM